jgi:membrane-associated phospholipid phosphatase
MALAGAGLVWADAALGSDSGGWGNVWRDSLVVLEAVALERVLTFGLKLALRRPKPTHYRDGGPVGSFEQQLSFPSGHAGAAAVLAAAVTTTFFLRHPDSPWRFVVLVVATVGAGFAGMSRVLGGRHFLGDVIAGWGLGAACGVLVPLLHAQAADATGVQVTPAVGSGGASLQFTGRF